MAILAEPLFPVSASDVALTNDEWYTPRWLFEAAGLTFDMDVCAPMAPEYRTCPALRYLTLNDDGLTAPWDGLVWMNPPYSGSRPWVERWAVHPTGLALVAAPQGSGGQRSVLNTVMAAADALGILSGGVKFLRPAGGPAELFYALVLAARGEECTSALGRVCDAWGTRAWHPRQVSA